MCLRSSDVFCVAGCWGEKHQIRTIILVKTAWECCSMRHARFCLFCHNICHSSAEHQNRVCTASDAKLLGMWKSWEQTQTSLLSLLMPSLNSASSALMEDFPYIPPPPLILQLIYSFPHFQLLNYAHTIFIRVIVCLMVHFVWWQYSLF